MYNAYAYKGSYSVTPSDSVPQTPPAGPGYILMGLFIGSTGTLTLVLEDGSTAAFPQLNAGTFLPPMRILYVKATGTSATGLIGFY